MQKTTAWTVPTLPTWDKNTTIFNESFIFGTRELYLSVYEKNFLKENIFFKPSRLLLHSLIVMMTSSIKFSTEQLMQQVVNLHYDGAKTLYQEELENLESSFLSEFTQCSERQGIDVLREKYKLMAERIDSFAVRIVNKYLEKFPGHKINIPSSKERVTVTIAGGQASGKGSSTVAVLERMVEKGLSSDDFVRINTDSYKPLVLEPGSVDKFQYSQLAQPEASMIHSKLFLHLERLANQKIAPHALIDQVFVGSDKIRYAHIHGGLAHVYVVSTEVITAIERSFERGMSCEASEYGRFENTSNVLSCHKRFAEELPQTLAEFVRTPTDVKIVDNNVAYGLPSECAAKISFHADNSLLLIVSRMAMKNLIKKIHIDETATSADEVYPARLIIDDEMIEEYLMPLQSLGMQYQQDPTLQSREQEKYSEMESSTSSLN